MSKKETLQKNFQKYYRMTPSSEPRPMREVHALELLRYYEAKRGRQRKRKSKANLLRTLN